MKKKSRIISAILFVGLAVSCNAQSQQEDKHPDVKKRPTPAQIMKDMDTNNDDKISKKEAKGPILNDFKVIDANNDGFITLAELKKAPKPKRPPKPTK